MGIKYTAHCAQTVNGHKTEQGSGNAPHKEPTPTEIRRGMLHHKAARICYSSLTRLKPALHNTASLATGTLLLFGNIAINQRNRLIFLLDNQDLTICRNYKVFALRTKHEDV